MWKTNEDARIEYDGEYASERVLIISRRTSQTERGYSLIFGGREAAAAIFGWKCHGAFGAAWNLVGIP